MVLIGETTQELTCAADLGYLIPMNQIYPRTTTLEMRDQFFSHSLQHESEIIILKEEQWGCVKAAQIPGENPAVLLVRSNPLQNPLQNSVLGVPSILSHPV